MVLVKKEALRGLIDEFLYNRLHKSEYALSDVNALDLLTWNRFDLAFKLFYLDTQNALPKLAEEVYKYDINAQTLGKFVEVGNEQNKSDFNKYVEKFKKICEAIEVGGFNAEESIVPVSPDGTILNGAHRVTAAIKNKKSVKVASIDIPAAVSDYKYFYKRNVPSEILDLVAKKYIEYSENIFIAFLWPSGKGYKEEVESAFSRVVYKKEIELSENGAFNLLFELYNHMDWVGNEKNGYKGIQRKLIECFPNFNKFTVIVFQSDSIEDVRKIKERVRNIYNLGYSSIHITDTKEEALNISRYLFNKNGLHFLNYAFPRKFKQTQTCIEQIDRFIAQNGLDAKNIVMDGSITLALYGLRESKDIDYFVNDNSAVTVSFPEFEKHDTELTFHNAKKDQLIFDSHYYFHYRGLKFISFAQLFEMKKKRNGIKDITDCKMMEAFVLQDRFGIKINKIKQYFLYQSLRYFKMIHDFGVIILKSIYIYELARKLYWKYVLKRKI